MTAVLCLEYMCARESSLECVVDGWKELSYLATEDY